MIRQHTPRESLTGMGGEHGKQVTGKIVHAPGIVADVMMMFITGRRDEKTLMSEIGPVRRRMPGMGAIFAPGEQLLALLFTELTPEVARCGHEGRLTGPHKCGTPNFAALGSLVCPESRVHAPQGLVLRPAVCGTVRGTEFRIYAARPGSRLPGPRKRGTPNKPPLTLSDLSRLDWRSGFREKAAM